MAISPTRSIIFLSESEVASYFLLTCLRHKKPVVSPVIGASKIAHLESAVKSLTVQLLIEWIEYLEELYVPHPVVGLIPHGDQ